MTSDEHDLRLDAEVEQALRRLRISGKLKGYPYLTYMIAETVIDPRRTELITKDLYHETAQRFDSEPRRVERAVRHAIQTSWNAGSGEDLSRMAGYPLSGPPSNAAFIDLVAFDLRGRYR